VLQIGSPKGVARLMQRAGRSGHAPGQVSRVSCVPSHALEFVEGAAVRRAARAGRVEARVPVDRPLDLLTQHLVTIAVGEGFGEEAMKAEVRSTRAFRDLTDAEWSWALDFVTRGGDALKAYPEYRKVERDEDGTYRVKEPAIAKRHRMSIGTIVSDAAVNVQYMRGKRLGNVEESFVARLTKGDTFVFAGLLLEFIRVENMTAYVRPGKPGSAVIPRWDGGRCPLSNEVADSIRELLEEHVERGTSEPEMKAVARLLKLQHAWSRVPRAREMLVEQTQTREGHHVFFYPFAGRSVHLGLSALLAHRLGRTRAATFSLAFTDYGFELLSRERFELLPLLKAGLLSTAGLLEDMLASLNAAELSKRQFREIARVAGLVFQGYPGTTQDQPPGAGDQRPHLGGVRALGSGEPPARAGRARGARAPARVLAPRRCAAPHGRVARAAAPDAQALALRLPDHGVAFPREAHQREARGPGAAHAARLRQGGAGGRGRAGRPLWLSARSRASAWCCCPRRPPSGHGRGRSSWPISTLARRRPSAAPAFRCPRAPRAKTSIGSIAPW
jgi:hypothetical protein